MPVDAYSWREDKVVPMLTNKEWKQIEPIINSSIESIKQYRLEHECGLAEAKRAVETEIQIRYRNITGERLDSWELIYLRKRATYGQDCPSCGKPFRTPKAKFCAGCGYPKRTKN